MGIPFLYVPEIFWMNPSLLPDGPECGWVKPSFISKKDFLINPNVLLIVIFDVSLISSIVKFTFICLGSKDFNIKLKSLVWYIWIVIYIL